MAREVGVQIADFEVWHGATMHGNDRRARKNQPIYGLRRIFIRQDFKKCAFTRKDSRRMSQLLLEPARRTGCEDMSALAGVLESSAQRQRSPINDLLDAGIVDEERYLKELAGDLGMEWLDSIPMPDAPLPLREAR